MESYLIFTKSGVTRIKYGGSPWDSPKLEHNFKSLHVDTEATLTKVHEIHSKLYKGDQLNKKFFPGHLTDKRSKGTVTKESLVKTVRYLCDISYI